MDIFIIILPVHINFENHQNYKRFICMNHDIFCAYLFLFVAECVGTTAKSVSQFPYANPKHFPVLVLRRKFAFWVGCLKQNHVRNSGNANWSWCRLRTPWIHITHQDSKRSYAAVTPRRVALTCVQHVVKCCHTSSHARHDRRTILSRVASVLHVWRTF